MLLLLKLGIESLAVGSISMTLTRSRLFRETRWWLARERKHWPHEVVWDLVKCPWCLSHWLGWVVVALAGPLDVTSHWWLDFVLNWFTIVALAPVSAFLIHRIYGALPPVPSEAEWHEVPDTVNAAEEIHQ
jgi:hypothetical protein